MYYTLQITYKVCINCSLFALTNVLLYFLLIYLVLKSKPCHRQIRLRKLLRTGCGFPLFPKAFFGAHAQKHMHDVKLLCGSLKLSSQ